MKEIAQMLYVDTRYCESVTGRRWACKMCLSDMFENRHDLEIEVVYHICSYAPQSGLALERRTNFLFYFIDLFHDVFHEI